MSSVEHIRQPGSVGSDDSSRTVGQHESVVDRAAKTRADHE